MQTEEAAALREYQAVLSRSPTPSFEPVPYLEPEVFEPFGDATANWCTFGMWDAPPESRLEDTDAAFF